MSWMLAAVMVIGMYDTTYPADCMELISVIVHALRGAIAPVRCCFLIVTPHCATFRSGVLANPHGLGVDTEHVLPTVYGSRNILAYFLGKPGGQLTPDIELPAAYKVWLVFLAVCVQTMKQKILTVESESLGCYAES